MRTSVSADAAVRAGDLDGLGVVYSESGSLMPEPGETIVGKWTGCDAHVTESWRSLFARTFFSSAPGKISSALYLTNRRLVLIRDIDIWKQVKPLLTPLGLPAAAEKESRLREMKARGGRQYCQINLLGLSVSRSKQKSSMLIMYVKSQKGKKYRFIIYSDAGDPNLFREIRASFNRGAD